MLFAVLHWQWIRLHGNLQTFFFYITNDTEIESDTSEVKRRIPVGLNTIQWIATVGKRTPKSHSTINIKMYDAHAHPKKKNKDKILDHNCNRNRTGEIRASQALQFVIRVQFPQNIRIIYVVWCNWPFLEIEYASVCSMQHCAVCGVHFKYIQLHQWCRI